MASNKESLEGKVPRREEGKGSGEPRRKRQQEAIKRDRAERAIRRDEIRQAQEEQKREKERERPQVVQKDFPVEPSIGQPSGAARLVNTTREERQLRDQGVVFSDGEDTHIYDPQQVGKEDEWETEEGLDTSFYMSELMEGGTAIDTGKKRVLEIQERTAKYQVARQSIEGRIEQLDRREMSAKQQERQLQERQRYFQQNLAEKEARVREEMNRKLQKQMYDESLAMLNKMENEMMEKQRVADEKERELLRREEALREAEISWKNKEAELEKEYLVRIRREIEKEILSRATALHTPPPSENVTQITGGARKKTIYYEPERSQVDRDSTYRKEIDLRGGATEAAKLLTTERIKSEVEDKIALKPMPTYSRTQYDTKIDKKPDHIESVTDKQKPSLPKSRMDETDLSKALDKAERSIASQKEGKDKSAETVLGEINPLKLPAQESLYLKPPSIGKFSGADPVPKSESCFEDWKLEVESIIEMKVYHDISIAQAIRKSLTGQARSVLQAMGPKAKPEQMISRLESIFGNVASGEAVLQEFYTAEQRQDESTVDWGLRLENVLQRAIEKNHVTGDKNEMLKSKFWRSLYNQDLKNATKMYKESIHDFEVFRKKVREEEYEMKKVVTRQTDQRQNKGRQAAQHQPVINVTEDQVEVLKDLVERMTSLEQNYQQRYQGYGRGQKRGRRGRGHGRRGRGRGGDNYEEGQGLQSDKKEDTDKNQSANQNPSGLNLTKSPSQGR